jgi:hypothetical protein
MMNARLLEQIAQMEASLAQMRRMLVTNTTNVRVDRRHTAGATETKFSL